MLCWKKAQLIRKISLLINPVMSTRFEAHKFCRLEPQVDLFLSALHRVTSMNDVPSEKTKNEITRVVSTSFEVQIWD